MNAKYVIHLAKRVEKSPIYQKNNFIDSNMYQFIFKVQYFNHLYSFTRQKHH
jgi:hypothetical protein